MNERIKDGADLDELERFGVYEHKRAAEENPRTSIKKNEEIISARLDDWLRQEAAE